MKPFDARQVLAKQRQPFATVFGKYELQYRPHLLGSRIEVISKAKDEYCCTICNQAKHTLDEQAWLARLDRIVEFRTRKKQLAAA